MFEVASAKFCESIGKDSLHPVPSYDQAQNCKLYSIVLKKKHILHPTQYEHSGFSIFDLFDPPTKKEDVDLPTVANSMILKWDHNYNFRYHGQLGVLENLMALFEGEITTNDSVGLKIDFNHVRKDEANLEELLELLKQKKLNLKHDLVQQVKHDHVVLCLIHGVWSTTEESTVTSGISVKVESHAKGDYTEDGTNQAEDDTKKEKVDGAVTNDITYSQKKSMTIPEDVPLAFEAHELIVDPEGNMTLAMIKAKGKFTKDPIADKED